MDVLAAELLFVSDYLESYGKSILPETQARAVIQLLTYLNRFELYQNYPNPALESKIHEFSSGISVATPGTQENWYRETMIRSYLKGNNDLFQENRSQLLRVLNEHGQELTEDFKDGVMSFYDGVLACIQKNPQMAKGSLEIATKKLASYPRLATDFFGGDLNILLIGKGMEDPNGCRQMLNDLLVTGMGVNNGRN